MAPEPRSGHARDHRRDCPPSASRLAAVDGFAPNDFGTEPLPQCDRRADAAAGVLDDDDRSFVFADIAAPLGDVAQRSEPPGQTAYLTALLAPLSYVNAPTQAEALLARFGSISAVTCASKRELTEVLGCSSQLPEHIVAIRRLLFAGLRECVERKPLDPGDMDLRKFLVARFSGLRHEEMLVMMGDVSGRFLDHLTLTTGSPRGLEFDRTTLFRRAAELGATQLILAHNHPSGKASASDDDIRSTQRVVRDGALLGIELRDHLIVAGNKVFSMKLAGLL